MIRTRRTLTAATLLATLVLLPSLASARPAATPRSHAAVHATQATSNDLLARLWHGLHGLWGKEGVLIDPNGAHVVGTTRQTPGPSSTSDEGMTIDPNG